VLLVTSRVIPRAGHAKSIGVHTSCKRRPARPVEVGVAVYPLGTGLFLCLFGALAAD